MAIPFFNLSDLTGSNGFTINGVAAFDTSGYSVSDAGDINGDGYDDFILGAPGFTGSNPDVTTTPGYSYVVLGSTEGFPANFELSTLDGTNGFAIKGIAADDFTGFSVSDAGDVNGDGYDDVIIGAIGADPNGLDDAGQSYVVFGGEGGFDPILDLATLNGANGFTINGSGAGDDLGRSVSSAGDINGDGFDDLIVGADDADPNGENSGQSYVLFGSNNAFPSSFNVSDLDGNNGFTIDGIAEGDESGVSVSGAGDVNADGFDDLIIAAFGADPNGVSKAGQSYLVFGKAGGFSPNLNLSALDGTNGFAINGIAENDYSGEVSSAGDVNGDGFYDIIIGAFGADPNDNDFAGISYVVFGSDEPSPGSFNLSQLDGTNGFAINGIDTYDLSGFSVSSAGDINGDGLDDLLIGAVGADSFTGQSYVVFGKEDGFAASINLDALDPTEGFALNGVAAGDYSAISVSTAGDINGDGYDDLIVGASFADPDGRTNAGSSYVIFGRAPITGDAANNSLFGTVSDDTIYAGEGNDQIFGSEGVNTLFGQDGNDSIYGGSQVDYMYAGNGDDTIYASEGNNKVFGEAGNDILYSGTGNDLIDGGIGNDTIWLGGGLDTVVLESGNGFDTINNFQVGQTTLGLSGGLTFEDLNIVSMGNVILIGVAASGESLVRIENQSVRVDMLEGSFAIV